MASLATEIRLQKITDRQLKKTYKGLNDNQRAYIKALERHQQLDKELNHFYATAPRVNGMVEWNRLDEKTLDYFEHIHKGNERAIATMSKISDLIDADYTLRIFQQINCHSESY